MLTETNVESHLETMLKKKKIVTFLFFYELIFIPNRRFSSQSNVRNIASLFGDTDGKAVHPNEEGHRRMASLVIGYLQSLRF